MDDLGKLVEYNTSCAPAFVQQAGIAAVQQGERFTQDLVLDLKASRDHLVRALSSDAGCRCEGASRSDVPVFLDAGGVAQSRAMQGPGARSGLGLAPGSAFGPQGEGFVRWCYACDTARLDAGVERLQRSWRSTARVEARRKGRLARLNGP